MQNSYEVQNRKTNCDNLKEKNVFGHGHKFEKKVAENQEKTYKNAYLGSILKPGKFMLRVCFEGFYEYDIQSEVPLPGIVCIT